MKKVLLVLALALCVITVPVYTGCTSHTTLEQGGVYSDANLAVADQAILNGSHALSGFLNWHAANADYLAQWPEVGNLAAKVTALKDGWIRDAYAARDAYASASQAYKKSFASGQDVLTARDKLNAALAVLDNITTQINAYKTAHPHA